VQLVKQAFDWQRKPLQLTGELGLHVPCPLQTNFGITDPVPLHMGVVPQTVLVAYRLQAPEPLHPEPFDPQLAAPMSGQSPRGSCELGTGMQELPELSQVWQVPVQSTVQQNPLLQAPCWQSPLFWQRSPNMPAGCPPVPPFCPAAPPAMPPPPLLPVPPSPPVPALPP
jgi:hypothetical protein